MIVTLLILSCLGAATTTSDTLTGENVCSKQVLETKKVNVTHLESVRRKKHSLCLKPPFLCAEWINTMETRVKEENITRLVTRHECCPGYKVEFEAACRPVCSAGCGHGTCTEPEVCTCQPGFSGPTCQVVGCPRDRWGPDCGRECSCGHGGWCDPVSGACQCGPGYLGDTCGARCGAGTWGPRCGETCQCETGEQCHHVTGECSPCSSNTWGEGCRHTCTCHGPGTELCSHKDGRCFCAGNWFGRACEQHCPFGYSGGTCHTRAVNNTCQCATELYTCDPALGCVCPGGAGSCGLEVVDAAVWLAPYSDPAAAAGSDQRTAAISLSVILIAGAAIVLVILYYRRRMGVMRKDIQNRSVYYCDSEAAEDAADRSYDLIIRDREPGTLNNDPGASSGGGGDHGVHVLNNVRLTLDSQLYPLAAAGQLHPPAAAGDPRPAKNVNIDNAGAAGACGGVAAGFPAHPDTANLNLNLDPDKCNLKLKVAKAGLEVMIRNNLAGNTEAERRDRDEDGDSVHKLKVSLSKNNCM